MSSSQPSHSQSFALFANLPLEIRDQIWQSALYADLPARLLDLHRPFLSRPSLSIPSLLHVNRESRHIALSVYVPWPLSLDQRYEQAIPLSIGGIYPEQQYLDRQRLDEEGLNGASSSNGGDPNKDGYIYVSPSTDTFIFRDFKRSSPGLKFDVMQSSSPVAVRLRRQIRRIAVPCKRWHSALSGPYKERGLREGWGDVAMGEVDSLLLLGGFTALESIDVLVTKMDRDLNEWILGARLGDWERIVDLTRWRGGRTAVLITAKAAMESVRDKIMGWKIPVVRNVDMDEWEQMSHAVWQHRKDASQEQIVDQF